MNDANRTGPAVSIVVSKVVLAIAWIVAGSYATAVLMRDTPKYQDVLAALFLIVAPLTWWCVKTVSIKRADELHQYAAIRGLLHGLVVANLWAGLLMGGRVLSSLFLGAGEVNVSGIMQAALIFVGQQPAVAFLLSETMSFGMLRKYAKTEE